jgi:septal ring factor EnvC (AmiA/AmiB activator)
MSAELNILRHELAETRRKLAEEQRECEQLRKDNADLLKLLKQKTADKP